MADVHFHPEAQAEYLEAYHWYYLRSKQAAHRFESEVEHVLQLIQANPVMFAEYDDVHRLGPLRRYPYVIVYQILPGSIEIIAMAHTRRAPQYWLSRVSS